MKAVPVAAISKLPVIDLADRGNDLAPAGVELLCVGKFEPHTENSGAMGLGNPRHLHDPLLVVAEEAIPLLGGLKVDFTPPKKFGTPISDVRNEHDREAALARPIERNGDVPEIIRGAKTNVTVVLDLGIGMNRDAVNAQRFQFVEGAGHFRSCPFPTGSLAGDGYTLDHPRRRALLRGRGLAELEDDNEGEDEDRIRLVGLEA